MNARQSRPGPKTHLTHRFIHGRQVFPNRFEDSCGVNATAFDIRLNHRISQWSSRVKRGIPKP
jgi:hypothetical protein